ncbi:MAG: LacI family DNA-binding transcriptional regulator [Eubacteriales bacterium]|nr:LacI family DNA-binding transcriptional regulator [Eubacteriales bacterium]
MPTTLKDIASETNLSITTVSLVLNHKECRISEPTKQLIFDTAQRLNYRPNQLAVGLVKRQTKTVGLIIPDISNQFFSTLALGIDAEMIKHERNIILVNTNDSPARDLENLQILHSRGVDAIILAMASNTPPKLFSAYAEAIKNSPIPIVAVDRCNPALNCSSLMLNNKKGAYLAVSHLLSLGHKNIAFITGPLNSASTQERLDGINWAYEAANLTLPKKYIFHGDYLMSGGISAAEEILRTTDATAIFAFNDVMAIGAYHQVRKQGLSVPDDISIIGFDDISFSDMLEVPLTTISQPTYEIGLETARRVIYEIENPDAQKQTILFEPQLVIRKSVRSLLK